MPSRAKGTYTIQSVENALNVLEALCDAGDEVRITHLSERLGMNKTSVFRLLATFERRGYVEREEKTGKYRLGLSAYEMGQKFLSRMSLLRKAKPIMERLARECNEAIYLAVPRETTVLFLDMVDTTHQVKIISLVGRRYSMTQTCAGQVILAHGKRQDLGNLVVKPEEGVGMCLDASLGICHDRGALGEGIGSAATAILNNNGEAVGSICLVGPEFRLTPEKMDGELLPRLAEAGEIISSKLGHVGHFIPKEIYR